MKSNGVVAAGPVTTLSSRREMYTTDSKGGKSSFASSGSSAKVSVENAVQGDASDGRFMLHVAIACGLSGLCALITMGLSMVVYLNASGYYRLGENFVAGIGQSPLLWRFFVFFPIGAGAIITILNLFTMHVARLSYKQALEYRVEADLESAEQITVADVESAVRERFGGAKRYTAIVFLGLSLAFVIAQAVFALTSLGLVDEVDSAVREGELNGAEPGTAKARILDFQVAMFNECCAAQNFTRQGPIEACGPNFEPGTPVSCEVEDRFKFFEDALCTCYLASEPEYASYVARVHEGDLCSILSDATVQIDETAMVPGTGLSISNMITADEVLVVGDPANDGCGVGYAKGFQFVFYMWLKSFLRPIVAAFAALAMLQLFAILFGLHRITAGYGTALIRARLRFEEEEEYRALRESVQGSRKSPAGSSSSQNSPRPGRRDDLQRVGTPFPHGQASPEQVSRISLPQ